jgi:hypothetical protein
MIGGEDIVVEGPTSDDERGLIVSVLSAAWPHGLIQGADELPSTAVSFPIPVSRVPVEFFVYRDRAALTSWARHGARRANADSMIHVIFEEKAITFVIDTQKSEAGQLVQGLLPAIRSRRISVTIDDLRKWRVAA